MCVSIHAATAQLEYHSFPFLRCAIVYIMARSHIFVRPLRVHDSSDVLACENALMRNNAYIPNSAFTWPSTRVLVAEKNAQAVLYVPVYTSYVLGSLGPCTDSDFDLASAQLQIVETMVYESHKSGFGELLCQSGHPKTDPFARRHQFVPQSMMKLKVIHAE